MRTITLSISVLIASLGFAEAAAAQAPTAANLDGRVQLGVQVPLAGISFLTTRPAGYGFDAFQIRVGPEAPSLWSQLGLGGVIGFGITDAWLADLQASFVRERWNAGGSVRRRVVVEPGLAHVFAPGQAVRPFVGGRAFVSRFTGDNPGTWGIGGSLRGGLQLHVVEHLSLDPFVSLHYTHFEDDVSNGGLGALAGLAGGVSPSTNTVELTGGVTVSVWL